MWLLVAIVLLNYGTTSLWSQELLPPSPCPSVFSYEGRSPEPDRWYGVVLVTTDSPLTGMRLDIRLSHRAQLLGNWEGEVTTADNRRFIILSLDKKILPGPPVSVRIFVRFDEDRVIPYVDTIALNGRQICPPPQVGINQRPQSQTSDTGNTWSPSGLETGLEPAQPLQIDDNYQLSIARPDRVTQRPSGNYDNEYRPSGGYDNTEYERPQPPRQPGGNEYRPTRRPSNGYDNTEYERPEPARQPGGNYDNEYQSRPNGNSNNEYQDPSTTRRPSNGYNTQYERPEPPRQPTGNYDNEYQNQPTTRRPSGNSNNEYQNQPTTRRPSGNSNNEYQNQPTTRRPSGNSNNEYQNPSTTKRPSSNSNNEYQNQQTTRRPSGNNPTTARKPSNSQTTRKPTQQVTTRRPTVQQGNVPTTHRPSTLNIAGGPSHQTTGNKRPPPMGLSGGEREECGRLHISATPLVTNGQSTSRGQWPWHAAIYKAKGINLTYVCGGTLVSSMAIVTAAHCVTKTIGNWPEDPDILVVYLGKYHLKLWSEGGVQNKQVAQVHVHPQYNNSDFRSDLAVLVLSSPADFTQYVRPICLWGDEGGTDLRDIEGQLGYVVGWGYDEEGRVTEQLMMARMPIVSQTTCLYSYPDFFSHFTSNTTYCAGFHNASVAGTSVCNGDSGGGMVLPEQQRDGSKVWRLRGLVSISVSQEEKRVCDTKHYVVFTDLAKYQSWIRQYLN